MCTETIHTTLATYYYYDQDLWEKSEADAEQAVELEPSFMKAYARF